MDITMITQLIGTLGFPIAVCIACFWFINKTMKENTGALNKLVDKIADLIKSFKEEK